MISKKKSIMPLYKFLCLSTASVLLSSATHAQIAPLRQEKYDSIAIANKNQNAVYTDYTYKLDIAEEEGELTANTHVKMEKLLISDASLNMNNTDAFLYDDFNIPTDLDGVAYIPNKKDYKKVDATGFGQGGVKSYLFYDGIKYLVAYYSGLKKNSVTQTRYSLVHTDVNMLPAFYFAENVPVLSATFQVSAPKYVKMQFVYEGIGTDKIVRTEEERNNIVTYKFTMNNIPAFKEFENVPSTEYYIPHIIPYIVSYRITGAAKDSLLSCNPEQLHKFENQFVHDLNMKTDTGLNRTVARITKNDKTDWEKANHICEWIQKNLHYIGFEKGLQGFVPRTADTVYKRKYGDCKDMASIAMAMCRRAGLEAYFTVIGTDDIPYKMKDVPLTRLFDHMICAVKINGKWMFIDGTHPELSFGYNRPDVQGKEAMILIDDKHYEVVTMPVEPAQLSTRIDSTNMSISYDNITGTVKQHNTGYFAWNNEYMMRYLKNEDLDRTVRAMLMRGSDKFVQKKYDITSVEEGKKDFDITADFTLDDYAQKTGKQYYVNMNLQRDFADSRINDSDRKVGFYYPFKQKRKEIVVLNIPEDCRVTYVPKEVKGIMDGFLTFKISYKVDAKKKTVTRTAEYELSTLAVQPAEFKRNNKLVDDLKNIYKESVVLTAKK